MGYGADAGGERFHARLYRVPPGGDNRSTMDFFPIVVTAFLFQHAVQGWCPPLPIIRRLGYRTMREIDEERFALKTLRGDFARVAGQDGRSSTTEVVQAVKS